MNPLLSTLVIDVVEQSLKQIIKSAVIGQAQEAVRVEFLRTVTDGFTKEISHNLSNYVNSIGSMTAEVDSNNEGDKLFLKLQRSLKGLESQLEKGGENSPILQYLKNKYGAGKESTLVGLEAKPVYSLYTSPKVDENRPWLSRISAPQKSIEDYLALEANRLLEDLLSSNQNT